MPAITGLTLEHAIDEVRRVLPSAHEDIVKALNQMVADETDALVNMAGSADALHVQQGRAQALTTLCHRVVNAKQRIEEAERRRSAQQPPNR